MSCQHGFEHRASIGRVQHVDGNGVMLNTFEVGDWVRVRGRGLSSWM